MKELVKVRKNVSPEALAKLLGLPDGIYGAFKGENGIYIAEASVFFGRMRELGFTPIERLVLIGNGILNSVPSGNYQVRKTRRAYSLESAA